MPDGSIRSTAEGEDEMMAAVNKAFEKSGIKIPATNEAVQDLGQEVAGQEVAAVNEEGNLTAWILAPRLAGKRLLCGCTEDKESTMDRFECEAILFDLAGSSVNRGNPLKTFQIVSPGY